MGTHLSLLVNLLGGPDLKYQEVVMNEIEEYVHPVLNWVLWEMLYLVSFYKLVPCFHLELRVGFVNWALEESSLFPDPAAFLEMQLTKKHLECCLQSCSRSTSQRLDLVKTVARVGTTSSQSYNRRLDFIAMTAVKAGEEQPEEAQDGFSACSQKRERADVKVTVSFLPILLKAYFFSC